MSTSRALMIAGDVGPELRSRGLDAKASDEQVEIALPGLYVVLDAESSNRTLGWIWRRDGDDDLVDMDSADLNREAVFEAYDDLFGDDTRSKESGVRSMLLVLRKLLSGYLEILMADHVEHVKESGIPEDEMASLGLLDIKGINSLNESLAKVEEAIKEVEEAIKEIP